MPFALSMRSSFRRFWGFPPPIIGPLRHSTTDLRRAFDSCIITFTHRQVQWQCGVLCFSSCSPSSLYFAFFSHPFFSLPALFCFGVYYTATFVAGVSARVRARGRGSYGRCRRSAEGLPSGLPVRSFRFAVVQTCSHTRNPSTHTKHS